METPVKTNEASIILLMFLVSVSIQVIFATLLSYEGGAWEYLPWPFHTIWAGAFIYGITKVVKYCGVSLQSSVGCVGFGAFFSCIFWAFVPSPLNLLERHYVGVNSRLNEDTHTTGRFDENTAYDHPIKKGFLYAIADPRVKADLVQRHTDNKYVGKQKFIFLQTGIAMGYDPDLLQEYTPAYGFWGRIGLFVTVGPVFLIESTINAFFTHFFLFFMLGAGFWLFDKWKNGPVNK